MQALVLKNKGELNLEDFPIGEKLEHGDVRIDIKSVGICGSDIHYYLHGKIGPYLVKEPIILGHEASGVVSEVGAGVTGLQVGDRVCMEPGVPDWNGRASSLGMYNVDPSVRFWATPPVHGCLRESVVHPAKLAFRLPDKLSFAEGAMVEPMAIGMYAATKAGIRPGDTALVLGAGTMGLTTVMSALAGGCSKVIVSDVLQPKLDIAASFGPVVPVNAKQEDLGEIVARETGGWGVDIVFEASGNRQAFSCMFDYVCPGGRVVLIGIPQEPAPFDVPAAQAKEAVTIPIFRYAHMYPKVLALMASGSLQVEPLISEIFPFSKSVEAFELAVQQKPEHVKIQISLEEGVEK